MICHPIFNLLVIDPDRYVITGTKIQFPFDDRLPSRRVNDAIDWFTLVDEGAGIKRFIDEYAMTPRFFVEPRNVPPREYLCLFGEFSDDQGIIFKMWMADAGFPYGVFL